MIHGSVWILGQVWSFKDFDVTYTLFDGTTSFFLLIDAFFNTKTY